jgi:glyoxylase-like metal-dependent hydrolase (beta-lactamase superfamily II)
MSSITISAPPTSTAAATSPDGAEQRAEPPLEQVIPGLLATAPEELPFGENLRIRAYLLRRAQGNVLLYRSAALPRHEAAIERAGGVARHYLNHAHEAGPVNDWVRTRFGAPLFVHAADAGEVERVNRVRATFRRRHALDDDLEVIPIPGHTPGATAYLWHAGAHRVLFTGDSVLLGRRGWRGAFLEGTSDRASYVASVELLAGLDFDLIVPAISRRGRPAWQFARPEQARVRLLEVAARLRAGESG